MFTKTYINADRARILGNYEEAFKLYAQCLDMNPASDAVHYEIGKLFVTQGNLSGAKLQFERALKLDPENKWYYQELAITQADLQDFKGAAKTYGTLRQKHPNDPDFIINHANFLLLAGDEKKAIKAYDEFEAVMGVDPDVSLRKYRYFASGGKYELAAAELEKLIALMPNDAQLYGYLADLYQSQGKTQEALEVYKRALDADPNNAYVQLSLAEYHERIGKTDTGFEYLKMAYANPALDIDTKVGVLLRMYGQAARDRETRRRTLLLCDNLAMTHPTDAKAHSIRGDFLYLDEQRDSARASYQRAVAIDPTKFAVWSQLLVISSELNDPKSMLEDSKKAMELFPEQPTVYLFNGIANNQLKHYEGAVSALNTGASLTLGNPALSSQMLAGLGDALHELGRDAASDSAYRAALTHDPNSLYALNNFAYFLALRGEQLDKALEMSAKTIAKEPQNASYQDTYGWALFMAGRYDEAEKHLKMAMELSAGSSSEVLEHYGDALFKLNRTDEAVEYWQRAKNAGSTSETLDKKISARSLE